MTAYDRDFHAWAHVQAEALRRRSANEIDWDNIAEEIESLGKQQFSELRSRLAVLLLHLLKWSYQPERRGRSWSNTIREQRRQILEHISENPSLKPRADEALASAYQTARSELSSLLDQDEGVLPEASPYRWEQVLARDWLPDDAAPPTSSE